MANQPKKCAPRAVVTPMRNVRAEGEDSEDVIPPSGARGARIPESVSLWPAVGLDVCRVFGLSHQPLPSAQAVIDRLMDGDSVRQTPGMDSMEEFLQLLCSEENGVMFHCNCSGEYLARLTGSGSGAESVLTGLAQDVGRVRGLRVLHPAHAHRWQLLEEFLQHCALMLQRVQQEALQTHAFHNIFTSLAAVASLNFCNGADCFRHTELLNTHVVSIPTLRLYLPLGGSTDGWSEPSIVSIAEITRDSSEPQQSRGGLSSCLTQLVGELFAEQPASAFHDKTMGFAIQGTKVQLALLMMDAAQRNTLNRERLTSQPAVLFTSPALDMCLSNERRMLLVAMAQLGLYGKT